MSSAASRVRRILNPRLFYSVKQISNRCFTNCITLEMSKPSVNHEIGANAFVIHLGKEGKEKALLEYVKEGDVLNLWHTEVPVNHRRQGLGAHLAKAALDHAVEKNYQVKPTCTYIQKYLKDNPLAEYTERVIPID